MNRTVFSRTIANLGRKLGRVGIRIRAGRDGGLESCGDLQRAHGHAATEQPEAVEQPHDGDYAGDENGQRSRKELRVEGLFRSGAQLCSLDALFRGGI